MVSGGRHQPLDLVTVAIQHILRRVTVGTGIIVSSQGRIITCDHVVRAALKGISARSGDPLVGVYFPQSHDEATKLRRASIVGRLVNYRDDLVVLELTELPLPAAAEVAILGPAEASVDRPEVPRF